MASLSFAELIPGYEFPPFAYELDNTIISKYLKAVEAPVCEYIPPLAIAVYAMNSMTQLITLPPGSIHASQEFAFLKPVPIGAKIRCCARVVRKLVRSSMNMLVLETNVFNEKDEKVQSGKTTIVLPASRLDD
jgi:hypothetical protein